MASSTRARIQQRPDDFDARRQHLLGLSDAELKTRFWFLCGEIVSPLVDLARTHTSPSIERSVLLRMGFSSLEAKEIVDRIVDHGLLGKGAGNVVLRVSARHGLGIREAGLALAAGQHWEDIGSLFAGGDGR